MRILVLQLKRIGDLVLTTPALHALKAAGHEVTLVATGASATLLPLLGDSVDEGWIYPGREGKSAVWQRLWHGAFDACVDYTGRDRSALMTLVSHAGMRITADALLRRGGWRRWCYSHVVHAPVRSRHTVDHYLEFLAPVGLGPGAADKAPALQPARPDGPLRTAGTAVPILSLPVEVEAEAARALAEAGVGTAEEFIVIHPGSARSEKYWVAERWAEVVEFCQSTLGGRCVLTGGRGDPYEDAHLGALRAALAARGQKCADLAGCLDLPTLAAVLARAALVVGVDSGPMHLAAAWQRPQIVLFGPTNPFHWRPRHPAAYVLCAGHGDGPLQGFVERSSGGKMEQISTRAVIGCIGEGFKI